MNSLVKKARKLLSEGKVNRILETERRIHFKVIGQTETHSVIFDKEKNSWSCDCKFSTLSEKNCSHIIAAKLFLKKS